MVSPCCCPLFGDRTALFGMWQWDMIGDILALDDEAMVTITFPHG